MSASYCVIVSGLHDDHVNVYGPLDADEADALAKRIRDGGWSDIERVDVRELEPYVEP